MEDIKNQAKSIQSIINDIGKGRYNFDLPIQRRAGIWNNKEISLFIDSLIRMYPVYPALLNKHSDTKILDVVDFKQRFTGLYDFVVNNKFALSKDLKPVVIDGVEYEIAGKRMKKLDDAVKDQLFSRDITVITMVDATPDEINDIFDRINMGHPLTNGHKRSTIESDEVRDIIYKLASHPFFEKTITKANRNKNVDRDTVIQILMLTESSDDYDFGSFRNNDMNKFITHYNELINNEKTKQDTLSKVKSIQDALDKLDEEFKERIKIKTTSLVMVCYGMYKVCKDHKSGTKYLSWLHDFLDNYEKNESYLIYCRTGSASSEMVNGRLNYFKDAIKTL